MAKADNLILSGLRGAIGDQLVVRVRNGKTFLSKYPDMSKVKPSPKQLKAKARFAKAVQFAKGVNSNPQKKAAFKTKKGESVFQAAIKFYLKNH